MTGIVIVTFNILDQVFLLQIEAIKKFCQDEFEIQIIDNSTNDEMAASVQYHAIRMGCLYQKTRANDADFSRSHAFAANVGFQLTKNKYDKLFFLDHDCIPVKPFSIEKILDGYMMGGVAQNKEVTYFWPGCFMFNNKDIAEQFINFSPDSKLGLDTGGQLHKAIENYGRENCIFFDEVICQNQAYAGEHYSTYNMICNETFMHFVNASNWNPVQDNQLRVNSLINIAREKAGL